MQVTIKYFVTFKNFQLVHANSHQNAFSSKINKFESFEEAKIFAEKNNCIVI